MHLIVVVAITVSSWWRLDKIALPTRPSFSLYPVSDSASAGGAPPEDTQKEKQNSVPKIVRPKIKHRRRVIVPQSEALPETMAMESEESVGSAEPTVDVSHSEVEGLGSGSDSGLGSGSGRGSIAGPWPLGPYDRLTIRNESATEGQIKLRLEINANGQPDRIQVVASLRPELDSQAFNLATRFRFSPCRDGKGRAVACTIYWIFHVKGGSGFSRRT